jgi:hypothetical protein
MAFKSDYDQKIRKQDELLGHISLHLDDVRTIQLESGKQLDNQKNNYIPDLEQGIDHNIDSTQHNNRAIDVVEKRIKSQNKRKMIMIALLTVLCLIMFVILIS